MPMERAGTGITVTIAVADAVRSTTLVAVMTAVVVVLTAGAVYNPALETLPTVAVQVTAVSLVLRTVA